MFSTQRSHNLIHNRKSTIAKLVQRFYDPTEGRILLDGMDLKDINVRDLRACIGVVSQEPLLFDTTIEENIRFGKPDATFQEIVQAAEAANAHVSSLGTSALQLHLLHNHKVGGLTLFSFDIRISLCRSLVCAVARLWHLISICCAKV